MKKVFSLLLTIFLVFGVGSTILAADYTTEKEVELELVELEKESEKLAEKTKVNSKVKASGNTQEDVTIECVLCGDYYKSYKIRYDGIAHKFEEYLTSAWAQASQYEWSASTTTEISVTGSVNTDIIKSIVKDLTLSWSKTISYSVAITIPADSSKYSKLALYGDYKKYYAKTERYSSTAILQETTKHYAYDPTTEHYLKVVYK